MLDLNAFSSVDFDFFHDFHKCHLVMKICREHKNIYYIFTVNSGISNIDPQTGYRIDNPQV